MQSRIIFYSCLALLWIALAVALFFRAHERWLGQAEDWKRYVAIALALLMVLWNIARIYKLLQLKKRREMTHGPSF